MRRNNLARNLERFTLQRVIAEDERLYKIDIEANKILEFEKSQVEWMTQAEGTRRAILNPDPNSPFIVYEPQSSEMRKVKRFTAAVWCLAALGLVLAAVLGAMS